MSSPSYSILYSAKIASSGNGGAAGTALIADASTGLYVVATEEARGSRRTTGIALAPFVPNGVVEIQQLGRLDASISGIGPGSASWVRVSSTGALERCAPAPGDDIVGWGEADGAVYLVCGVLSADIVSGGGGSPAGSSNEMQYRGNDGGFAAVPCIQGSDAGLLGEDAAMVLRGASTLQAEGTTVVAVTGDAKVDMTDRPIETLGGVALQWDAATNTLHIGARPDGGATHPVINIKASTGVLVDAPAEATKATQSTAMGDLNCPVNVFIRSELVPDDTPVFVPIWDAYNVPTAGTLTFVAKVVLTSSTHSAEFDLHAKWRATSPGVTVLTARATEDPDSINPDGLVAEFVENAGALSIRLVGTTGGPVRMGGEVAVWMVMPP